MKDITIDEVRNYTKFTDKFLCSRNANIYNIRFRRFKVRDIDSDFVLFEVSDDSPDEPEDKKEEIKEEDLADETIENSPRTIRYHLGPDFLDLKNIGSSLTFSVGNQAVKDFLMIERHYFRDTLIKSFEFKFDFCIPNSVNTWEYIYVVPDFDPEIKKQMIENPWETRSDSFYFVEGKLIMHNKALYNYSPLN
jgi:hypothetical protein